MNLEDELGDVVQKARFGLGLDRAELARRTGMDEAVLAALEAYRYAPSQEEVEQLARCLGLALAGLAALAREAAVEPAPLPPGWVRLYEERFRVNAYLYLGEVRLLVDAGVSAAQVRAHTDHLDAIFLTHEHHDHIDALSDLRRLGSPRVYGHAELAYFLPGLQPLADQEQAHGLTAIATPGHSALGFSYFGYGAVATGDAVYARSLGRAESPDAYPACLASLARILALPDDTVVLPGHGPSSTVGDERRLQPFIPRAAGTPRTPW